MGENIYKKTRKDLGLTRQEVCDKALLLDTPLQPERLERIENGKFDITPDEVLLLSKIYNEPILCNYYCANKCDIGKKYIPKLQIKDLTQIVLEILSSLNSLKKRQERLIEITADGVVDGEEIKDFVLIAEQLEKISVTVQTLQIWVEQMIADEKIDIEKYNAIKNT